MAAQKSAARSESLRTAPEAIISALRDGWTQYDILIKKCRKNPKRHLIHDFRTQLRQLISVLDLLEELDGNGKIRKLRRRLKAQIDCVKALRDLQVQEKTIRLQTHRAPAVEDFLKYLRRERKTAKTQVRRRLRKLSTQKSALKFLEMEELTKKLFARPHESEKSVLILKQRLNRHYRDLMTCSTHAKASDPVSLHQMRIQFRKYRYAWRVIHPLMKTPEPPEAEMKATQDLLGEIQDTTVLIQSLYHYLARQRNDPEFTIILLLRSYEKKQERVIAQFFQEKGHLLSAIQPHCDQNKHAAKAA